MLLKGSAEVDGWCLFVGDMISIVVGLICRYIISEEWNGNGVVILLVGKKTQSNNYEVVKKDRDTIFASRHCFLLWFMGDN